MKRCEHTGLTIPECSCYDYAKRLADKPPAEYARLGTTRTQEAVMAEVVAPDQVPQRRGIQPKYRFEDWADGEWRRFRPGDDYGGKPESFIGGARNWAGRNGLRVVSRKDEDGATVYLKFEDKDQPEPEQTEDA